MLRRVRDVIFERPPYDGFDAAKWPSDMQGWHSDHPILNRAIERIRPASILEIGSWKGRSAINMARHTRALGLNCEVVCVDTWLGSSEHWLKQQQEWYADLKIEFGLPNLYYTFLSNVVREGVQDIITPFPNTSDTAALVLSRLGFYFDLCYVDAAHEYEPVKRDLTACWGLLREPGILVGDDYNWSGVSAAVNEFAAERGIGVICEDEKFALVKGRLTAPI